MWLIPPNRVSSLPEVRCYTIASEIAKQGAQAMIRIPLFCAKYSLSLIRLRTIIVYSRSYHFVTDRSFLINMSSNNQSSRSASAPIFTSNLSPGNNIQHPAINRQNLPVNIRILRQKQHRHGHFLIRPSPLHRHMSLLLNLLIRQLTLLVLSTFLGRHLRRKVPWRDAVDADGSFLELAGHQLG